jgi:hypothetical protein
MGRSLSALSLYWRLDDMREISQETHEILKSQRMLGVNKYNYELKLDGVDYYSDIENTIYQFVHNSADWGDYCIRSDGKVLFAYLLDTEIYLKVIESESEMLSEYNTGINGDLFYTLGEVKDLSCFTLLRLSNGKIMLALTDIGNFNNNIPYTTKIFISDNGLGNDFYLANTLHSSQRIGTDKTYCRSYISKPVQDAQGGIYFTTWKRRTSSSYDLSLIHI